MGKLTAKKVETLRKPGHHVDGDGLALLIGKRGGRSWVLRTMVKGKRRDIGLGGVSWVSLAEARERARALRKVAREGGDPLAQRRADQECPTFEEAARRVHAEQIVGTAKNEKHRAQWLNTLRDYAFAKMGTRPIRNVAQADVLSVLAPIWTEKPETARRVRQRIRTVMDWARAAGHFEGVNPVEGVEKGLARQKDRITHHAAMPWAEIPAFLPQIGDSVAALALRFLVLTAARTGEVIGARWGEINLEDRVWTVPAERMKAQREHRVPLSDEAIAILERVRGLDPEFIFPGQRRGKGLSNMAMTQLLRRLGRGDVTIHGFRSAFRDWCEEKTRFSHEVKEVALAHVVRSKTERAYRRTDLFDQRRELMEQWAHFCCPKTADVVPLSGRR